MLKYRKLWLTIHEWLGVALFVALIPLSVTGAILVWDQPIERMLRHERFEVSHSTPVLSPSEYVAAAQLAFGGRAQVASVRLPEEAGIPVTVVGQMPGPPAAGGGPRQLTAWLDPASAKVTDVAEVQASAFSVIHRLHGSLLIPGVGRKIVGWLGWAMSVSSVTGVILWWPRNGAFLKGFRWGRTPMVMDNLHHLIGFWICLPLAVLSLTGVYISFPQSARAVFGQPTQAGQRARPPQVAPLAKTGLTIDEAVSTAREGAEAKVLSVTLPTAGKAPNWRVELKAEGEKAKTMRVDDTTREVQADRGGGGGGGRATPDPVSRLMRKVHDGAETGPIWQTIIVLGGIAPAVLGITGVVMWVRRQLRKTALRAG